MNGLSVDSGLVGRQSTSLVRAENSDTSELLDGGDTGDDDLVLRKLLSTKARVTDKTVGMAIGISPIKSTRILFRP